MLLDFTPDYQQPGEFPLKRKPSRERLEKLVVCQVAGERVWEGGLRYSSQYKVPMCQVKLQEENFLGVAGGEVGW